MDGIAQDETLLIGNRFRVHGETACIALPLSPWSLTWKTPVECVWDDSEFSQNELSLESKTAIRHIIEEHAPGTSAFFTNLLNLTDAGIHELLADLTLMQRMDRDDPNRVYRLYERIESHRRSWPTAI